MIVDDPYWMERAKNSIGSGSMQALGMTQEQLDAAAKRERKRRTQFGFGVAPEVPKKRKRKR